MPELSHVLMHKSFLNMCIQTFLLFHHQQYIKYYYLSLLLLLLLLLLLFLLLLRSISSIIFVTIILITPLVERWFARGLNELFVVPASTPQLD